MRVPVYPEKLRKYARFMLRIRYILLALLFIGPALLVCGIKMNPQSVPLIYAGIFLSAAGGVFFSTIHAHNAMIWLEIRQDGLHILDKKGEVFRSAEYRHIQNIEIRTIQLTEMSSEDSRNYPPASGFEARLILVYLKPAGCFEDLKLQQLGKRGKELYWRDALLYHHNCFAFEYSEDAWALLNEQLASHIHKEQKP